MKKIVIVIIFLLSINVGCKTQHISGDSLLTLDKVIKLPEVSGRIDHFSADTGHGVIYVAALGNNTVEVINLSAGEKIYTVKGLDEPQGVLYIPDINSVLVSNGGNGYCRFFDGLTFQLKTELKLDDDADNIRYDPESKMIYVGYGSGGIAVINALSQKLIGTIKLDAHPESFQLDSHSKKLWVNVPRLNLIEVVDGKAMTVIAKWKFEELNGNFPMAYDSLHHRLFIGCRSSSTLLVLNSDSGEKITSIDCVGDADDIFYDETTKLILVSGGEGYIDIFRQETADNYKSISRVLTSIGARTSMLVPCSKQLIVAVPAHHGQPAELRIFKLNM